MTWQVSPEEWLLDFTAIPRGRPRGGESLDIIDDRLRAILAPPAPAAGIVIPTITASRAAKPAAVPVPPASARGKSGPREAAAPPPVAPPIPATPAAPPAAPAAPPAPTPAAPAPAPTPGLSVELHSIPPPPPSASMVIPTLTRPGAPADDEAEAIERLTPPGGTEVGIPHDDAEDLMSAVVSSAMLGMTPEPEPAPVTAPPGVVEEHDDVEEEALEVHEVVESRGSKPPDKPGPPPRPTPVPAPPSAGSAPSPTATPPRPPPVPAAAEKVGPPRPPPAPDKPPPPARPPERKPAPSPAAASGPMRAADTGAKKRRGWHDEVFGDYYAAIMPLDADASADIDAAFVQKCLDLSSGLTLLDVACGDGRHAASFARLGLDVTALDSSMPQLLRAARRNESSRFNFDILHGDMRNLPRDRVYDVVTCLGTSFGYFDADEVNRQCLQDMVEVLKPGGKLALHVLNRDYLMGVLPCRSWWQGRGCLVLDVADMNFFHGRIRVHRTVVFEDGRQFEHHISMRAYSVNDLGRMLAQAGARVLEVSGSRDTRGRFYGAASPDIWIFARREDV